MELAEEAGSLSNYRTFRLELYKTSSAKNPLEPIQPYSVFRTDAKEILHTQPKEHSSPAEIVQAYLFCSTRGTNPYPTNTESRDVTSLGVYF